ncbi:unnamed protein product [Hermetia illucens]|uniref:Uncharacterized protein n=1 Tax=Hermetia illucens TaxID=343691 RepID=A0A7R8YX14_HERIL|nr:uncharacterized protein LOC119654812 [Hermetia illucens]CAD7088988.1 unnamed protein product [Hermetia illucens]
MEKHLISAIIVISLAQIGYSATDSSNQDQPDYLLYPYCFRFTWLGPKYDGNSIIGNATCSTILEDAKDIPCKLPLIATNNSNLPDTDWLWENHKSKPTEIACRLSRGDVCVKYSYIYNSAVQNITYMCTKVTIDGEGAAKVGTCYSQIENGKEVEVCVCESTVGSKPCNHSIKSCYVNFLLVIFSSFLITTGSDLVWNKSRYGT